MTLSELIKYASESHSLEYLLTLPVMSKIEMTGEDGTRFTVIGKKGLYSYQDQNQNFTIRELIQLLPIQKYQFQIEFESEERDIVNEAGILRSVIQRKPELKEKLKELESEIAKDPKSTYYYAQDVIKGRFPLGESAIAQSAQWAYQYAEYVIKGRFPLAEPAIAQSAQYAYQYARDVIKGRFELGESVIAKDPKWAYWYAKDIIKGRWIEGEPVIATSAEHSWRYAAYIIRGRWELGEPVIAKDPKYIKEYSKLFFRPHEIDFKSKSLNKYNKFRDLYIHQLKIKFPEWIKIPLEFQEGYLLYRGNGGKNLNPTSKILEKWKLAKNKIDKLKIEKQAGLLTWLPEKILKYIIKNPKSVMVDSNRGDYYRAVEFWTGCIRDLRKLELPFDNVFGSILKLFTNELKSKDNSAGSEIEKQIKGKNYPEGKISIDSDDTLTNFIINYQGTKNILEVLAEKKNKLNQNIAKVMVGAPDKKVIQKMNNQLQKVEQQTDEAIQMAKNNQGFFVSSDHQQKIKKAAVEIIKDLDEINDEFDKLDPWTTYKTAGMINSFKNFVISIFKWIKSFFIKIDELKNLVRM
jgi:hypothetical protein